MIPPQTQSSSIDSSSIVSNEYSSCLLAVKNLSVSFSGAVSVVSVVRGVNLAIRSGRTTALVGESGCGKSVTALSILRLLPSPPARIESGLVLLGDQVKGRQGKGVDLLHLSEREMRRVRGGRIAMTFQDPLTSLNPVMSVGGQVVEAIELHQPFRGRAARDKAIDAFGRVGLSEPARRFHDYPHQLSGGMRQRVMIAMALACEPELLIADEPTTALDVTIQAQILELLRSIQDETGMGLLLITHDLGVVATMADEVYVMYAGRIVERAPVGTIFSDPRHPYTRALLRCTPRLRQTQGRLEVIPGSVPDPSHPPSGCRFHPRCALARERGSGVGIDTVTLADGSRIPRHCVEGCDESGDAEPVLRAVDPGHEVACWEA